MSDDGLSEAERVAHRRCKALLDEHRDRLAAMARETIDEGYDAKDFVLVCMDSDDPEWVPVIAQIMRAHDLDQEPKQTVVMGALSPADAFLCFAQLIPSIAKVLTEKDDSGAIRVLVVNDRGASLFFEELIDKPLPN